jgi:hypothetical protein
LNHLSLRKGPEFNHILSEHAIDFEKMILNLYFDTAEAIDVNKQPVPNVIHDLMWGIGNPKFHLAGLMGHQYEDPNLYFETTEGMTEDEEEQFLMNLHEEFYGEEHYTPNYGFEELLHEDINVVMNFHNICFIDAIPQLFSYHPHFVIRNEPIIGVW